MKILHTSDWHIGKLIHNIHMTKDQAFILDDLLDLIRSEKPNVMIIAGDIYDRSVPPVEAVELLDEVLTTIVMTLKIPVIAIAGNHDNGDRVSFASKVLRENEMHIIGSLSKEIEPIIIPDEHGPVAFYPVPFCEPAIVKSIYEEDSISTHDDAMKVITEKIKDNMDKNIRNVCIAHGFITGTESLETSESERPISIGGSEYISVDYFEDFNYVALGHLHRPQKVKHDYIQYAGSLMKYSFSEAKQKKSVSLIDLKPDGSIDIDKKTLKIKRDVRVIKGNLEQLMDPAIYEQANTDDYIMAILTDKQELIDPIHTLRSVYPNILRLEKESILKDKHLENESNQTVNMNKSPVDLFKDFYSVMSIEDYSEEKELVINKTYEDIMKKERAK